MPGSLSLVLTLSSACSVVGMLLLSRTPDAAAQIAAHRFTLQQLPADNVIPQIFAERFLNDQSPKALIGDWSSSDRPPLATGWMRNNHPPDPLRDPPVSGHADHRVHFVGGASCRCTPPHPAMRLVSRHPNSPVARLGRPVVVWRRVPARCGIVPQRCGRCLHVERHVTKRKLVQRGNRKAGRARLTRPSRRCRSRQ